MVHEFKTGKWYRFTGDGRGELWNRDGHMDFVLNGRPRLCLNGNNHEAQFAGDKSGRLWSWRASTDHFEECDEPFAYRLGNRLETVHVDLPDGEPEGYADVWEMGKAVNGMVEKARKDLMARAGDLDMEPGSLTLGKMYFEGHSGWATLAIEFRYKWTEERRWRVLGWLE